MIVSRMKGNVMNEAIMKKWVKALNSGKYKQTVNTLCSIDEYGGVIHNYDYKPRPYFFGKRSDLRLYFGFELEVECRQENPRETAERVQNLLGDRVYLKSLVARNVVFGGVSSQRDGRSKSTLTGATARRG